MFGRFATTVVLFSSFAACLSAQGLDTNASKDDWEEINFEFNSSVLSDGYPSLLRLSELLKNNTGYKVKVEGYTDRLGGDKFNEKLGLSRATTVKDFLVKYGARANQVETGTRGKQDPKYAGQKPSYSKTDVARWMNRRVVLTVTDDQGRMVSAGGPGDAIRAMDKKGMPKDCCDEILKRLDKLDDIARMLKDLADQNAGLRKEVDALKQGQAAVEAKGVQPTTAQTTASLEKTIEKMRDPRFSLLGVNIGEDANKDITFSGKARYFAPFHEHFAIQAQGEYLYFKTQREGQFDLGLVDRVGNFQGGLFASFKHVNLAGNQDGGNLGQAALTFDYIFGLGKVGIFGTKAFMDNSLINRTNLVVNGAVAPNIFLENYLRVVDQVGVSTTLALFGNNYLEGNIGYLKSFGHADRPGGTLRFIFPVSSKLAFTVEGGMNETLIGSGNGGRAVVGIQLGNFLRPRDFVNVAHAVPVDVPRVRYEVLTRRVQIGSAPPVADAGPDQIGVAAGNINLDGSRSYDPNGQKLTYIWVQESGPPVALSSPTSPQTSFTSVAGQQYGFRLTVRNESGLTASARVRVTTRANEAVQILFFTANPTTINTGQSSTLAWKVLNATEVTITTIGPVSAEGTAPVSPTQTTTYRLTARNATSEQNATATVTVQSPTVLLFGCQAIPTNIMAGESSTISWQSQNADTVSISGIGNVAKSGSVAVSPTVTTNYTITATGAGGVGTATCGVTVTVSPAQMPRIITFTANPTTITVGSSSTLNWQVENATTVTITPTVGTVALTGNTNVSPTQTTIYTLTATNKNGTVTAQATVTVNPLPTGQNPQITSFTANPPVSPKPGAPVVLTCIATNATSIVVVGVGPVAGNGTVTVNPTVDTTYTCTASGNGTQDNKTLLVKVTPTAPTGPPPVVVIAGGPVMQSIYRQLRLDASQSNSPAGNTPLTYFWRSRNTSAAVLNPTSPTPTVQLGELAGDYFFDLTVTDSKGNVSIGSIDILFVITHVP